MRIWSHLCHDTRIMRRVLRLATGLLLIPACAALSLAVWDLARRIPEPCGGSVSSSLTALGCGYAAWLLVFFLLPSPVRTYVLAHELTHAIWGVASGATVHGVDIKDGKGACMLSELNTLTLLSPYFVPFYTVIVCLIYGLLALFLPVAPYRPLWLFLVGFTWGFHFTFTLTSLMQHQTDIVACGRVFAYTFIYAANVAGIGLWLVVITPLEIRDWGGAVGHRTSQIYVGAARQVIRLHDAAWSLAPGRQSSQ